ncbi:hypothetical protein FQA39_LY09456 [Lamprigera yunnana]|nr:hypothetical protein FQA39_LY09456 [Lamprigera yunnana]
MQKLLTDYMLANKILANVHLKPTTLVFQDSFYNSSTENYINSFEKTNAEVAYSNIRSDDPAKMTKTDDAYSDVQMDVKLLPEQGFEIPESVIVDALPKSVRNIWKEEVDSSFSSFEYSRASSLWAHADSRCKRMLLGFDKEKVKRSRLLLTLAELKTDFEYYPPIDDMLSNTSLVLTNSDPIFHKVRPLLPSVIQIGGGIHRTSTKPLPKEIKTVLDSAEKGFIYFSLGSNVKSKDLKEETRNIILETFAELPYTVLWKFELENLPNKPSNVLTSKWLPQPKVLNHCNIKLFITQGGLQSMDEAIYSHIPMVGVPFFADQDFNIDKMVKKGFGLSVDYRTLKKEDFKETILEVINNPNAVILNHILIHSSVVFCGVCDMMTGRGLEIPESVTVDALQKSVRSIWKVEVDSFSFSSVEYSDSCSEHEKALNESVTELGSILETFSGDVSEGSFARASSLWAHADSRCKRMLVGSDKEKVKRNRLLLPLSESKSDIECEV